MIEITTYMIYKNYKDNTEQLIRVDELINYKEVIPKLSSIYNQYCIEIKFCNKSLTPLMVKTIEPWISYVSLIKDYLTLGYAEIQDLTKPIKMSFYKDNNQLFTYKIKELYDPFNEHEFYFPEKLFFECLVEALNHYLESMEQYDAQYTESWLKRFSSDLQLIQNNIQVKKPFMQQIQSV